VLLAIITILAILAIIAHSKNQPAITYPSPQNSDRPSKKSIKERSPIQSLITSDQQLNRAEIIN
jgi:hypothetical protein